MTQDKYTLRLADWHTPATDYPEATHGNFRIHHRRYTRGIYEMHGIDGYMFFEVIRPIPVTYLEEKRKGKWNSWMLDDPPHWRSMEIYAAGSKGRVLTTGLGLGLVVNRLASNPEVKEVVVVERSIEVIRLIEPNLPESGKVRIVLGDFYNFINQDSTSWDTIIVDLWVTHGTEEKLDVYLHRVIPLAVELKIKHPKASITFHGFYSVSDIPFASKEMVDKIISMKWGERKR